MIFLVSLLLVLYTTVTMDDNVHLLQQKVCSECVPYFQDFQQRHLKVLKEEGKRYRLIINKQREELESIKEKYDLDLVVIKDRYNRIVEICRDIFDINEPNKECAKNYFEKMMKKKLNQFKESGLINKNNNCNYENDLIALMKEDQIKSSDQNSYSEDPKNNEEHSIDYDRNFYEYNSEEDYERLTREGDNIQKQERNHKKKKPQKREEKDEETKFTIEKFKAVFQKKREENFKNNNNREYILIKEDESSLISDCASKQD